VLAGQQARLDALREQVGEVALRELGADVRTMAGRLEEMGVRVEGPARARVTEDAADLDDVEADVDDQVAREGVAEIVEAHPSARPVEPGVGGGAAEHPLGDVVVQKRRAVAGREHVIGTARETGPASVLAEDGGELGEEGDLADGGARLRWDAVRRDAAAAARELVADVDDAGGEVDVVPGEAEHLRQTHTRIRPGE
jgi:hypothetical protein